MFAWEPEEVRAKYGPHEWVRANLGHSMSYCKNCGGTPGELAVIGDMNHCEKNPSSASETEVPEDTKTGASHA